MASPRSGVRVAVRVVLGLIVVVALFVAVTYLIGSMKLTRDRPVEPRLTSLSGGTLERGEHLVRDVLVCEECHAEDLGGYIVADAGPFALFSAPNLTTGEGGIGDHSVGELDLGIRYGIGRDQRATIQMPSHAYQYLTDADLSSVIAYLRSVPPIDRELPDSELRIVGRIMTGLGKFPIYADIIDPETVGTGQPGDRQDDASGEYIAKVSGCHACHGANFEGYQVDPEHFAPAIHAEALADWSKEDFERAIREGKLPDGEDIDPFMPWPRYAGLEPHEFDGLWEYVRTIQPE